MQMKGTKLIAVVIVIALGVAIAGCLFRKNHDRGAATVPMGRHVDMGLLSPAWAAKDPPPSRETLQRRYAKIVERIMGVRGPKVKSFEEDRFPPFHTLTCKGLLWVTLRADNGAVVSVMDEEAFTSFGHYTEGDLPSRRVEGKERAKYRTLAEQWMKSHIGITPGDISDLNKMSLSVHEGHPILTCTWHMIYHGYKHDDDQFGVHLDITDEQQPVLVLLGQFGRKTVPPAPPSHLEISESTAIGKAKEMLADWPDAGRFRGIRGAFKVHVIMQNHRLEKRYVPRNDWYGDWDHSGPEETHFVYVVNLIPVSKDEDTAKILNHRPLRAYAVWVDCSSGEIVGGRGTILR